MTRVDEKSRWARLLKTLSMAPRRKRPAGLEAAIVEARRALADGFRHPIVDSQTGRYIAWFSDPAAGDMRLLAIDIQTRVHKDLIALLESGDGPVFRAEDGDEPEWLLSSSGQSIDFRIAAGSKLPEVLRVWPEDP